MHKNSFFNKLNLNINKQRGITLIALVITIIILLVLGDKIGGVIGMVLIVPIAVIIKVIYDDIDYYLF